MAYTTEFERRMDRRLQRLDEVDRMLAGMTVKLNMLLEMMGTAEIKRLPVTAAQRAKWASQAAAAPRFI